MRDRAALARILPFAVYMAFIVVADLLGRLGWSADQLRWLYPVKAGAVLLALFALRRAYGELAWTAPGWRGWLAAIGTGLLVLVLWINMGDGWMVIGQPGGFDPRRDGAIDWPLAMLRLGGAALVVPVMEELFWRSYLMRWVDGSGFLLRDPARVSLKAFAVTALLFGFEHNLWLAGIIAGVAYGFLYQRSRNLWLPILAHAVTNGGLGLWIITTGNWTYW